MSTRSSKRTAKPGVEREKITPQNRQKPRHWSAAEDQALRDSVAEHNGKSWKKIASRVPGRNHVQCLQRWKKVLAPGLKKGAWTKDEDYLLISHRSINFKNWGKLAGFLPGRTAKQCRERWYYNLNPEIQSTPFTEAEDEKILQSFQEIKSRWSEIARRIKGRTENSIKTRFKSLERGALRMWTKEEDDAILKYAADRTDMNKSNRWDGILEVLPARTKNACKVRYKVLENNQKDKAYKEMAERVGGIFNNFSKLEKYLPMLRELAVLHKNVAKAKKSVAALQGSLDKAKDHLNNVSSGETASRQTMSI